MAPTQNPFDQPVYGILSSSPSPVLLGWLHEASTSDVRAYLTTTDHDGQSFATTQRAVEWLMHGAMPLPFAAIVGRMYVFSGESTYIGADGEEIVSPAGRVVGT